jgi:hypothetical protein
VILVFAFGPTGTISATLIEGPRCVFVSDTKHNVHGAFLFFYLSHNGVENFGAPLTEAFMEDGRVVQYFERARFELHPENPEPYRVQLGLLGALYYGITDPPLKSTAIPPPDNPNFRYFPESGQMIAFTIKEFFDSHGGIDVLGFPISSLRFENGPFAQYFQRMRLEWNPADSGPNKIRTSPVGQLMLDKRYPPSLQWRARAANDWCPEYPLQDLNKVPIPIPSPSVSPTPMPPNTVMTIQVRVRFRQTGPTGPQYVDVSVDDQNGRPFVGAALYAIVHLANGDRVFPLLPSDASGKSAFSFDIGNQPANSATLVEVFAQTGPLTAVGRDVFTR